MSATVWSHVALNCRNVATTEDFYRSWFGFRRARSVAVPGGEIVFLRAGNALLELFPAEGVSDRTAADGAHDAGCVRHIAFQTDDIDELLRLMGASADVTLGPLDFSKVIPGWRTAWVRDPDGVIVEISQGYVDAPMSACYRTTDVKEPA